MSSLQSTGICVFLYTPTPQPNLASLPVSILRLVIETVSFKLPGCSISPVDSLRQRLILGVGGGGWTLWGNFWTR